MCQILYNYIIGAKDSDTEAVDVDVPCIYMCLILYNYITGVQL
jgi:hypothetical protein